MVRRDVVKGGFLGVIVRSKEELLGVIDTWTFVIFGPRGSHRC